jgi:hypothetical protein
VKEWYDNTLLSRLNNKSTGCIIIVMQRLHQDDLVDHVLPQDDWTVLSSPAIAEEDERVPWDTASKTSDLNDYSVCTTWSVERDKYYLLNAIRRRLNYPDLKRAIVAHAKEYGSPTVVIEDKSSGTQLIQDLRNEAFSASSITSRRRAPTSSRLQRPVREPPRSVCLQALHRLTITSPNSSDFRALSTTIRSPPPPRRWTICASRTSSPNSFEHPI